MNSNNQFNPSTSPRWGALILAATITLGIFASVGLAFENASAPAARAAAQATAAHGVAVASAQPAQ